ncbi:hypothetical protein PybrP1_008752 [[Pythium] brassicae (nom. inval.)]|nr:hypothetical protein PybrP1_008752 [[Pythium] brassicae (nom. inval.)]
MMYSTILGLVADAAGVDLAPGTVACDFEAVLINADVCRRQMKKMRLPEIEIGVAMTRGVLDMLTVVDQDVIADLGMAWVRNKIRDGGAWPGAAFSSRKWRRFWIYFEKT